MKLLSAFAFFVLVSTATFANPTDYVCFKNDGLYVASVSAEVYTGGRWLYEHGTRLNIGERWCTNNFYSDGKDYANLRVVHWTGFEYRETCKYEKIKSRSVVVANGTTYNYWCHITSY